MEAEPLKQSTCAGAFKAAAATHLEMQVVNGAVCSQGVVAQSEVWVVAVFAELQRKPHGCLINELRQAAHDARHQQHMSVLNWTDIYEDQVGAAIGWRSRNKLQFAIAWQARLILEQHFLLERFLEVELLGIPRLAHLQRASGLWSCCWAEHRHT